MVQNLDQFSFREQHALTVLLFAETAKIQGLDGSNMQVAHPINVRQCFSTTFRLDLYCRGCHRNQLKNHKSEMYPK